MNENLLQRLVGAVVLGAVVLIMWPVVMTPGREDSFVIESDIPPRPIMREVEIARPLPAPSVEARAKPAASPPPAPEAAPKPRPVAEPVAKAPAKAPAPRPAPSPALDKNGLPVAWIVQVGSFGNPDNAARLKKALSEQGFKVHTVVQRSANRSLTRVIVGPYVDKAMAERDRGVIAGKTDLAPKVLRFKS